MLRKCSGKKKLVQSLTRMGVKETKLQIYVQKLLSKHVTKILAEIVIPIQHSF